MTPGTLGSSNSLTQTLSLGDSILKVVLTHATGNILYTVPTNFGDRTALGSNLLLQFSTQLGLRYSFADFINPSGPEIATLYRQQFADSEEMPAPVLSVAIWVICAETTEEAQRLASSSRMTFRLLRQGKLIPVPPVEKALRFLEQQATSSDTPGHDRRGIIGDPDKVREGIQAVARDYGAEEVMVVTITHDHAARRRSYELIAEAFGLAPGAVTTEPARSRPRTSPTVPVVLSADQIPRAVRIREGAVFNGSHEHQPGRPDGQPHARP